MHSNELQWVLRLGKLIVIVLVLALVLVCGILPFAVTVFAFNATTEHATQLTAQQSVRDAAKHVTLIIIYGATAIVIPFAVICLGWCYYRDRQRQASY